MLRLAMPSFGLVALLAAALTVQAKAPAQNEMPAMPGLEVSVGETVVVPGATNTIAFRFKDGRICVVGGDKGIWSSDGGRTWTPGPKGPGSKTNIDLGGGEILSFASQTKEQPDGTHTMGISRSSDNWATQKGEQAKVDIPGAAGMIGDDFERNGMIVHHGVLVLKNGDLLMTMNGNFQGDTEMADAYPVEGGMRKTRNLVLRSSDRGKTWGNAITVAHKTMLGRGLNSDSHVVSYREVPVVTQEGFGEADLTRAPNGDILCVMRSGGRIPVGDVPIFPTPMYLTRSSDEGKTWTPPVQITDRGVCPYLTALENGIIVCSYSRPGQWLIFSDDNGITWKGPVKVANGGSYFKNVPVGSDQILTLRHSEGKIVGTFFTVKKTDQPVSASAEQKKEPFKITVPEIKGLKVTPGETAEIPGATNTVAFRFNDGRIVVTGDGKGIWSRDNGKTWTEGPRGPAYKTAIDLGGGEILAFGSKTDERENAPHDLSIVRSTDNWATQKTETAKVNVPQAAACGGDDGSVSKGMIVHHGALKLKNGDLMISLYGNYQGDTEMAATYPVEFNFRKTRTVVVSSSDNGRTWGNPITVAYDTMLGRGLDTDSKVKSYRVVPAVTQEGFLEPDLVRAPNGDILCMMRSGGRVSVGNALIFPTPLYVSRSSDEGKTWTPPVQVADRGVCPYLVTLENGVIVCAYGRPGGWLIFSDDNGKSWKGAFQICEGVRYVRLLPAGPDKVLAIYYGGGNMFAEPVPGEKVLGTTFTVSKAGT